VIAQPQVVCTVCGSKKARGGVCQWLCFWEIEGWAGWDGRWRGRDRNGKPRQGRMRFFKTEALKLWALHRLPYNGMLEAARLLGWGGQEGASTLVPVAAKAKAAGAGK